ncbi:MAG: hypothetical protein JOZ69_24895 [Myxococcales bacterium]|nr:hypothetical protein [Myxococcales bacterium]
MTAQKDGLSTRGLLRSETVLVLAALARPLQPLPLPRPLPLMGARDVT